MTDRYWGEAPFRPRGALKALAPWSRFLFLRLAPLAAAAVAVDVVGTGFVFVSGLGSVSNEANAMLRALWPAEHWSALPAVSVVEFASNFFVCAWFSFMFYGAWLAAQEFGCNPDGWWKWTPLVVAALPVFGVATWLTPYAAPAWSAALVLVTGLALVAAMVPRGHLVRQRWEV